MDSGQSLLRKRHMRGSLGSRGLQIRIAIRRAARAYVRPRLATAVSRVRRAATSVGLAGSRTKDFLVSRIRSRPDWKATAYIAGIAAGFLVLTVLLELPHGPEHWSADLRTAYLSPRPATQDSRIALVYVNDKTLERLAYVSPVDRKLLADLVQAIDAAEPQSIGLDFLFDRPTELSKDSALLNALQSARSPIVLGAVEEPIGEASRRYQDEFLTRTRRPVGHLYFDAHHSSLTVSDHVVRYMAERHHGKYPKGFAEILAEKAGAHIPHDSHYISWLLAPRDGSDTFLTLSAEQVLGGEGPPLPLAELLKGKIVLVGSNAFDRDRHVTPLSLASGTRYPGLFIHAQILAQHLDGRSLRTLTWQQQLLLLLLAAGFGFWIGRLPRQIHLLTELVSVIALIAIGIASFWLASMIFPYTGVLLAWLAGFTAGHHSRHVHA